MRIAHFTPEYPPSTTGGLGTYLQALVAHQRRAGDTVDVFFLGQDPAPEGTLSLPFYRDGELFFYTRERLAELSQGAHYDVVVCQDWPGILVSQPLWRRAIPLVTTCHLPLTWDIGYFDDIPCAYADKLEFMAMMDADAIITVSASVKRDIEAMYPFTAGKIQVVHNGTDTTLFSPGPGPGPGPGLQPRSPLVLFVGRYVEQKGFDLLPAIFSRLARRHLGLRFAVIGTGPLKQDVMAELDQNALMDRVTVHEFSSQEAVLSLYREASVVLMPSRREPFGLVATEAMATATPIVASDVDGLSEIISDGTDGLLVAPDDVEGFCDALSRVLTDPSLAEDLGRNARQSVLRRFTQEVCFEATRDVYREVTRRHRTTGR